LKKKIATRQVETILAFPIDFKIIHLVINFRTMKQESFDEVRRGSLESNNNADDEVPNIPRLHIPRASLSSSTTSSSKSSSTSRSREFSPPSKESPIHHEFLSESEPEGVYDAPISGNPISRTNKTNHHHRQQKYREHKTPKPSSLHSLSSTSSSLSTNGSNQSNYVSVEILLISSVTVKLNLKFRK
jgi:hypothetical protein